MLNSIIGKELNTIFFLPAMHFFFNFSKLSVTLLDLVIKILILISAYEECLHDNGI